MCGLMIVSLGMLCSVIQANMLPFFVDILPDLFDNNRVDIGECFLKSSLLLDIFLNGQRIPIDE